MPHFCYAFESVPVAAAEAEIPRLADQTPRATVHQHFADQHWQTESCCQTHRQYMRACPAACSCDHSSDLGPLGPLIWCLVRSCGADTACLTNDLLTRGGNDRNGSSRGLSREVLGQGHQTCNCRLAKASAIVLVQRFKQDLRTFHIATSAETKQFASLPSRAV